MTAGDDLLSVGDQRFHTILADPPWQFKNRTGKIAPEHGRLYRYGTLPLPDIKALPIPKIVTEPAHLYIWTPTAILPDAIEVLRAWGFQYKSMLAWHKIRLDGNSDGSCCGFYFRNVVEVLQFGVRGKKARTLEQGRRQTSLIAARKREHSRKPDEFYPLIEACSPGPHLELFARNNRPGWVSWGNEVEAPAEEADLIKCWLSVLGIAAE